MVDRSSTVKLAVIFTSFNRARKTAVMLESLSRAVADSRIEVSVFCCDDGSSDNTSEVVFRYFPEAVLYLGDGSLFWNGGMISAFSQIKDLCEYSGILCVNDDCKFSIDSFRAFLESVCESRGISGAQVVDNASVSYGGGILKYSFFSKFFIHHDSSLSSPVNVDWIHFNCAYISMEVIREVGFLDSSFTHSFGDIDFSLRVRSKGFPVVLHPVVGSCEVNDLQDSWLVAGGGLLVRLAKLHSVKGLPFRERFYFFRKHFPFFWGVLWLLRPYLHILVSESVFHIVGLLRGLTQRG